MEIICVKGTIFMLRGNMGMFERLHKKSQKGADMLMQIVMCFTIISEHTLTKAVTKFIQHIFFFV